MSQNLSAFHAELLDFIRRDAADRVAGGDFDETLDPELRAFQQKIASALEPHSENFPLNEIVEKYHYLFDFRGPIHLEKKLLEAFSFKEAKEFWIRIYRGLPRLYRREKPADSRLKKNFTHLSSLKRLAAEKAVFRLYDGMELPPHAKISFFTWVIQDGWGDYIAALESIEILSRRFLDLQLGWVVLFPTRLGSPPTPKGAKTHLIYYDKEAPLSSINVEAKEILRTSDFVIQIPTFYPEFDALCQAVSAIPFSLSSPPTWASIGEYGFLESGWFHPRTGNRAMGLHFLEKGILVKEERRQTEPSFAEIQNFEILQQLFQTGTPGPSEIEQYTSTHHFYLAYLTSPIGGAVYLHALAKAHDLDRKGIDLICPDIGWLIHFIEIQTRENLPIIEAEGVAVELHIQGKIVPLTKNEQGKKIRIFCPSNIQPNDFHLLVHLSGEFVGIRGNQSFSDAVSVNKGFYFDGRPHSLYFFKDLLALAENRIVGHRSTLEVLRGSFKVFLHNLPQSSGEWVEETYFQEKEPWKEIAWKIGVALKDPDCLAGFKKLNRIVAEEHAFNDFLASFVQRELCHRVHPEIKAMEEEAIGPFAEGRIGLSAAIEDLKNRLSCGR